MYIKLD